MYYIYIEDLVKKEPVEAAFERTFATMMDWCSTNSVQFDRFFDIISANEAAHMIVTGKISPWVLYLSSTGESLMNKFNQDHAKMIKDIIDPGFWMRKFKKNTEEVDYIRELLEQAGI